MQIDYTTPHATAEINTGMINQLNLGVIIADKFGSLLEINASARNILGLENYSEQITLDNLTAILPEEFSGEFDQLIESNHTLAKKQIVIKNFNGEYKNINLIGKYSEEPDGQNLIFYLSENVASLKSKRRCIDVVSQVAQAVSSSFANEKILNVVLSGATAEQGLGFNRAYIFLYDEKKDILNGHLAVGPFDNREADQIWQSLQDKSKSLDSLFNDNPEHFINYNRSINQMIKTVQIALNDHPSVKANCNKKEFVILNASVDDNEFLKTMGISQIVLAPMISNDKLIGLIAADNEINHQPLDEHACYILQILANQAAVAIERSDLYSEISAKAEELEKAYQKLTESQEQIIKVEKMSVIGELTASIAHELKNPMAIVGGFAHLLLKNKDKSDNEEYLKIITQEIKRSEEVLEHVLEFSKTSQNEKNDFLFDELIDEVLELVRSRMNLSRLELIKNNSSQKVIINGNYDQLKYALYQIIKLLIGDIIMPAKVTFQLNRQNSQAALDIIIEPEEANRSYTRKNLNKTFLGNKLSQRLPILIADEALRFHGGCFNFNSDEKQPIQLLIQLPVKEVWNEK